MSAFDALPGPWRDKLRSAPFELFAIGVQASIIRHGDAATLQRIDDAIASRINQGAGDPHGQEEQG